MLVVANCLKKIWLHVAHCKLLSITFCSNIITFCSIIKFCCVTVWMQLNDVAINHEGFSPRKTKVCNKFPFSFLDTSILIFANGHMIIWAKHIIYVKPSYYPPLIFVWWGIMIWATSVRLYVRLCVRPRFVRPDEYLQHQWIFLLDTLHMH